ncbi:MAG: MerR family transcriptional regulator [Pseudoflavonifractor sp.]
MRQLFRIGEVAKLFGMNLRTLRYYDQIGLLVPIYTDPDTRYRYYSTEQFERLNTIRYLRAQGVTLEEVAAQLQRRSPEQVLDLFRRQQKVVARQIADLQAVQVRLGTRVGQIQDALRPDRLEAPWTQQRPRRPMVMLRSDLRAGDDLELPLRQLENSSGLGPGLFLGKVGLCAALEDLQAGRFGCYRSLFCLVEPGDGVAAPDALPAGTWAQLRFRGTHAAAPTHYKALLAWLTAQGLTPCGDAAEFTLVDYGLTDEIDQFVTELQIPVDGQC